MICCSNCIKVPLVGLLLLASLGCQPCGFAPSIPNAKTTDAKTPNAKTTDGRTSPQATNTEQPIANKLAQQVDPGLLKRCGRIQFVNDSAIGRQLAKQHNLPCLLFFTADWCTFCRQMAATAFSDEGIGQLAERFVCVRIDADRDAEMCRQYLIDGYPTVHFVAADGRRLHRLDGHQTPASLAAGIRTARQRLAWFDRAARQSR